VRWSNLSVTDENLRQLPGYKEPAVVRHFDAPEALNTEFYEVRARSALNKVPGRAGSMLGWTINPYRGCTHACVYCFARPTHKYLDLNPDDDFEKKIIVKVNVPELLRAELARSSWQGKPVALGTNTDPYQWVEGRYKLMVGIWEAMRDYANPCSILTKSPLLLRDIKLFKELVRCTDFFANLSVPTLDEKAWRATEPHTPNPYARIEAVKELNKAGIPTGILVAPLMPGINDSPHQVERIFELATEAGARNITPITLNLRKDVKRIYFEWLEAYRPDLLPHYQQLYSGAYLSKENQTKMRLMTNLVRKRVKRKYKAPILPFDSLETKSRDKVLTSKQSWLKEDNVRQERLF